MSEKEQHHKHEHHDAAATADVAATAAATEATAEKREINVHPSLKHTRMEDVKFHFKKDKLGNKRPSVELKIPVPTIDGIIAIIEAGGKQADLLLSVAADVIIAQARSQVNDDENITQDKLKYEELSWDFIANIPQAERKGGGISKETWETFAEDYINVMPGVTGKSAEQIGNAAKLLSGKFQACKTNKAVLSFLKTQLDLWFSHSSNAEDLAECYEFLNNKVDTLLQADEAALLANL